MMNQGSAGFKLGSGQPLGGGLQLGGQLGQQQPQCGIKLGSGLPQGGLQLGGQTQPGIGQQGGLQLGGQAPGIGQTGLKLGTGLPAGGLQLGSQPQPTIGQPGGLQLGSQAGASQTGPLKLGAGTMPPPPAYSAPPGLKLGSIPTASTATPGLQLGQTTAQPGLQLGGQTSKPGLTIGAAGALPAGPGGLKLGGAPAASQGGGLQLGALGKTTQLGGPTATTAGISLGGPPKPVTTAPSLGGGGQTTALGGGMKLVGATSTASQPLGLSGLPKPATSVGLGKPPPTTATPLTTKPLATGIGGPKLDGVKTTATTTTTSAPTKKHTYKDLEKLIEKWTSELQAQEELFIKQAGQVNQWDRSLAENGDKIVELNSEVDRVKTEQERVDSELTLIQSQQEELEKLLNKLEEDIKQVPTHTGLHADMQRTRTFQMAESVDSQLKQMSGDLKMIIEQMNQSNHSQDENNPFTQIVGILNAHTDSLGWIDHEAALLRKKVDDVAKVTEYHRQEQESSLRTLAFSRRQ